MSAMDFREQVERNNRLRKQAADLVLPDIHSALGMLENPMRLVASLRR